MKSIRVARRAVRGGLTLLAGFLLLGAAAADPHDPRGTWSGKLTDLRLVFHVSADSTGGLRSSFDSPDQGAMGLGVRHTSRTGDSLAFDMADIHASFVGHLSADGARIEGEWRQGGATLPLRLDRTDDGAAALVPPHRPQEPKPPFPYTTTEVRYDGGSPGVSLAGTLTVPPGTGPFPCVLMITGSGPQDRDETLDGHRPFLVIADRLTRAGVAVLRVDDRGVGGSIGPFAGATSADFADDVRAGVRFLASRPEIDRRRIGLVGHSEGGLIAPLVAAGSRDVAFIVLLAGTGLPGAEISYAQAEATMRSLGMPDSVVHARLAFQKGLLDIAREGLDSLAVEARVAALVRAQHVDSTTAKRVRPQIASLLDPWTRWFLAYDPRPTLRRVRCPVLALNGSRDVQVPARLDLPQIESALRAGGNRDVTTRELPGLNHLFQDCTTGAPAEYGSIEETFSPAALDTMTSWILVHTRSPGH